MNITATAVLARRSHDRVLHGWYMYDWANSAFAVTILAALFGPHLDKVVVPDAGVSIPWLGVSGLSATSLYGYALGISALLVLLSSPVLGAIADATAEKKRFMMFFCYLGSGASLLLFFIGAGDVWAALLLFMVANFSFVSANVFYDAFLPHIAAPDMQDVVSGKGYAYGYAGGGLLFMLQLLLVQFHEMFGIGEVTAVRIALGSVGLWWGGFALITFARLPEPRVATDGRGVAAHIADGFRRIVTTGKKIRSLRQMGLFLLAFMIYNDGIQTVIAMATIYGSEELGFDTLTLMGALLMIQFVGMAGAQLFGLLAQRYGARNMVLVSLGIWTGVVVYAYSMTQPIEFWILGAVVGLVLGGSQALSRSLYSRILPPSASAEFFGFFSVFEKFSAIWGPIAFAVIRQATGSARTSIVSLIVFFVLGGLLLAFVRMREAEREKDVLEETLGLRSPNPADLSLEDTVVTEERMKTPPENSETHPDRLPIAIEALNRSIEAVGRERRHFFWQAQWLKRINAIFNVSIVFLGVAAAALVTYMTQQPFLDPSLKLQAILVVGLAGAFAILRIVLNWNDRYRYAVLTAMRLREIEANARLEREEILQTGSEHVAVGRLAALNRDVQMQWSEAIRSHLAGGGNTAEGE